MYKDCETLTSFPLGSKIIDSIKDEGLELKNVVVKAMTMKG